MVEQSPLSSTSFGLKPGLLAILIRYDPRVHPSGINPQLPKVQLNNGRVIPMVEPLAGETKVRVFGNVQPEQAGTVGSGVSVGTGVLVGGISVGTGVLVGTGGGSDQAQETLEGPLQ